MFGEPDVKGADTGSEEDEHAVVVPVCSEPSLVELLERVACSGNRETAFAFQAGCGLKLLSGFFALAGGTCVPFFSGQLVGERVEALFDLEEGTVPPEFSVAMGGASAVVLFGFSRQYFQRFIEGDPRGKGCVSPLLVFMFSMASSLFLSVKFNEEVLDPVIGDEIVEGLTYSQIFNWASILLRGLSMHVAMNLRVNHWLRQRHLPKESRQQSQEIRDLLAKARRHLARCAEDPGTLQQMLWVAGQQGNGLPIASWMIAIVNNLTWYPFAASGMQDNFSIPKVPSWLVSAVILLPSISLAADALSRNLPGMPGLFKGCHPCRRGRGCWDNTKFGLFFLLGVASAFTNVWVILNTDLYGVESVAFSGIFALAHLITFSSYTLTPAVNAKYRSPAVQAKLEDVRRMEQALNVAENASDAAGCIAQMHAMMMDYVAVSETESTSSTTTASSSSWWNSMTASVRGCCRRRRGSDAVTAFTVS